MIKSRTDVRRRCTASSFVPASRLFYWLYYFLWPFSQAGIFATIDARWPSFCLQHGHPQKGSKRRLRRRRRVGNRILAALGRYSDSDLTQTGITLSELWLNFVECFGIKWPDEFLKRKNRAYAFPWGLNVLSLIKGKLKLTLERLVLKVQKKGTAESA